MTTTKGLLPCGYDIIDNLGSGSPTTPPRRLTSRAHAPAPAPGVYECQRHCYVRRNPRNPPHRWTQRRWPLGSKPTCDGYGSGAEAVSRERSDVRSGVGRRGAQRQPGPSPMLGACRVRALQPVGTVTECPSGPSIPRWAPGAVPAQQLPCARASG